VALTAADSLRCCVQLVGEDENAGLVFILSGNLVWLYIAQVGLELTTLLPQLPKYLDYRSVPPCPA
jgi:hypothetical protein